jgi:hypothetical protein
VQELYRQIKGQEVLYHRTEVTVVQEVLYYQIEMQEVM